MMVILWYRICWLFNSPLFLFILSLIFKWLFLGEVECYSYDSKIYVIDRINDDVNSEFESWLVHTDCVVNHLNLPAYEIDDAILYKNPIFSPARGEVYIYECYLTPTKWCALITRHPETVYSGFTCIIDYQIFEGDLSGPRDANETLDFFLATHCVGTMEE